MRAGLASSMKWKSHPLVLIVSLGVLGPPCHSSHLTAQTTVQEPTTPPAQSADDRPHLKHQTGKIESYGVPDHDETITAAPSSANKLLVSPNLHLPNRGTIWALDHFGTTPELVHLKYRGVYVDQHSGSNFWKAEAAPFVYKPKKGVELKGNAAIVRLHDTSPVFYVRGLIQDESEFEGSASAAESRSIFSLVRLEVRSDRRVVTKIAFTQVTGKASKSQDVIDIVTHRIPGSDWYSVSPKAPLAPGEYGFTRLPKGQSFFDVNIYDFAIDPAAAENSSVMRSDADSVQ